VDRRTLVQAAAQGDRDAFAGLAEAAIAQLDGAARLIVRDGQLAQDAVQDALIKCWRDLPDLRDPDRFDAWLHRLLVRSCLDQLRRNRRRLLEVSLPTTGGPTLPDTSAWFSERDALDRALGRLSPERRTLVVLRFYLDLTLPDAAAALGIPVGTAKSRLHRALDDLRRALDPDPSRLSTLEGSVHE
jgi:RNA polymerase sigma-70 factor (ECF subfamily)